MYCGERDSSWPQLSSTIPNEQREIPVVSDLLEFDAFHFSDRLGKVIGSHSFEDANAYGTFIGDTGATSAPTTTSSYPYALGSREPTVIVLGICPACKVAKSLSLSYTLSCTRFLVRLACWNRTSPVWVFSARSSSSPWEFFVVWPFVNVAVTTAVLFSSVISSSCLLVRFCAFRCTYDCCNSLTDLTKRWIVDCRFEVLFISIANRQWNWKKSIARSMSPGHRPSRRTKDPTAITWWRARLHSNSMQVSGQCAQKRSAARHDHRSF